MDVFVSPAFRSSYEASPLVLADVGASGGLQQNWEAARKYLKVVSFEPDERAPKAPGVTYLRTGLFRKKTAVPFNLCRKQESSSVYTPNRGFLDRFPDASRFDVVDTRHIPVDTLDRQLAEIGIEDVDFVKLDTQGCELPILEGGRQTVERSVFGLEVEVEFAPVYEGQALFPDVDSFLREAGFELFDLKPGYWKRAAGKDYGGPKGQLIFADALYLRGLGGFERSLSPLMPKARRSKVLRAVSVCLLYGYVDYALELAYRLQNAFGSEEFSALQSALKSNRPPPNFRGRGRLAGLFHSLWRRWRPTEDGWGTQDPTLGNL